MEGDVEEVEGAEGDAAVVDCYCDGGEAEVEDYAEGVEEDAFEEGDVCAGLLVDGAGAGGGAVESGTLQRCLKVCFCDNGCGFFERLDSVSIALAARFGTNTSGSAKKRKTSTTPP